MRDGHDNAGITEHEPEGASPNALDACLLEAKDEILRRCGVRIAANDPVMAVLVAQDAFARRHAALVEAAVSTAADRLAGQLDRREAQMRERLDRRLADATREEVGVVHGAALDQRAEFLSALRALTERQERAARATRQAWRGAMVAAATSIAITIIAASLIL